VTALLVLIQTFFTHTKIQDITVLLQVDMGVPGRVVTKFCLVFREFFHLQKWRVGRFSEPKNRKVLVETKCNKYQIFKLQHSKFEKVLI
jgi:hypothetical protein